MKAKFTWRETAIYHTLIRWSDVLMRAELPYEYVNGNGPKFWYAPPSVIREIAYPEHIRFGSQIESDEPNGIGPMFWYAPPSVIGKIEYPEHVRLGAQIESAGFNMLLFEGAVMTEDQYDLVMTYLKESGKRLTRIKKMIEDGQEFVMPV